MFTAIEAREFLRYVSIQGERVAKTLIQTATSTKLGQRLMLGGLTAFVGLSADNKALWEQNILANQPQAGHTLVLDTHPLPADLKDLSLGIQAVTSEAQVNVGRFGTLKAGGFTMERVLGEIDPDNRTNLLIIPQKATSFDNTITTSHIILKRSLSVKPLDTVKFTAWVLDPATTPNLGCEGANCRGELVEDLIKRVNNSTLSTGVVIQEALVWINESGSIDRSWTDADFQNMPSIKSFGMLWWLENRDHLGLSYLGPHAFGHFVFNLTDERIDELSFADGNLYFNCRQDTTIWRGLPGDPGTKYEGCANKPKVYFRTEEDNIMGRGMKFGSLLTWWIENNAKLMPWKYQMPQLELRSQGLSSLQVQTVVQLEKMRIPLHMSIPLGTNWLKLWVESQDGPAITMIYGDPFVIHTFGEIGHQITEPEIGKGNYVLLPDQTYRIRIWVSNAKDQPAWDSPLWEQYNPEPLRVAPNPPAEIKVKTPKRDSSGIGLVTLAGGQQTNDLTPTLQWNNRDTDVFYYEVQLSKDSTFNTDPQTATAAIYWNLIHGGESKPLNSYTVPDNFPLEKNTQYFWRVRPRIQGDGIPVAWSSIGSFKTSADARVIPSQVTHWEAVRKMLLTGEQDLNYHLPSSEQSQSELTILREIKTDNGLTRILIPGTKQAVLPKEQPLPLAA